jgi:hypothetical protein
MEQQNIAKKRGRPRKQSLTLNNLEQTSCVKEDEKEYHLDRHYQDKTPSVLIQSALFGINEKREKVEQHVISTIGETKILFSGELLNQFDFDVFQALIEMAHKKKEATFNFTFPEVMSILKKENHSETRKQVVASIERLTNANIKITSEKKRNNFIGHLINQYEWNDQLLTNKITISTNTLDMFLFASSYDKDIRNKLTGNLTKFYYMFFCSHSGVIYDYNLETFHELTDSKSSLKDFKRMTINSFKKIFEITEYQPVIIKSNSTGKDKVRVSKDGKKTEEGHD